MARRKTLVADDRDDLAAALRETTSRSDLVVMSGGLGPTEDDLTAEVVAAAHGGAARAARALARGHPGALPEARAGDDPEQRQAGPLPARRRPSIPNRFGTAPGFSVRLGRARAGGPARRPGGVPGALARSGSCPRLAARRRRDARLPAGEALRGAGVARRPGHAPGHGRPGEPRRPLRLPGPLAGDPREVGGAGRGRGDPAEARMPTASWPRSAPSSATPSSPRARTSWPRSWWPSSPAGASGWRWPRAAPAGLVAELLTRVPGASNVFDLGVVAYANEAKTGVVGVPDGVCSRPTARSRSRWPARWPRGSAAPAGPPGASASPGSPGPRAARRRSRWERSTSRSPERPAPRRCTGSGGAIGTGCARPRPTRRSTCCAAPTRG